MICIAIVAETNESALKKMAQAYKHTDIVELRADLIRQVDLKRLIGAKQGKIIVTNRRSREGGGFAGTERERIELLKDAVMLGADYIDIEMSTDNKLKNELMMVIKEQQERTSVIVSWHDFTKTPSKKVLNAKLEQGRKSGADIVKIVPFAATVEDNLRILNLVGYARRKGQEIIAFCMGAKGHLSRVAAPLLGSCLSYVSLEGGSESAPGQLAIAQMQEIMGMLKDDYKDR